MNNVEIYFWNAKIVIIFTEESIKAHITYTAHIDNSVYFANRISKNVKSNIIKKKNVLKEKLPAKNVKLNKLNMKNICGIP